MSKNRIFIVAVTCLSLFLSSLLINQVVAEGRDDSDPKIILLIPANDTLTLKSGNYYFNEIKLGKDAKLITQDAVRLFITGPADFSQGEVINQTQDASQFVIISSGKDKDCISLPTKGTFCGAIYAPEATVIAKGKGLKIIGAIVGNNIKIEGEVDFQYDPGVETVNFSNQREIKSEKDILTIQFKIKIVKCSQWQHEKEYQEMLEEQLHYAKEAWLIAAGIKIQFLEKREIIEVEDGVIHWEELVAIAEKNGTDKIPVIVFADGVAKNVRLIAGMAIRGGNAAAVSSLNISIAKIFRPKWYFYITAHEIGHIFGLYDIEDEEEHPEMRDNLMYTNDQEREGANLTPEQIETARDNVIERLGLK